MAASVGKKTATDTATRAKPETITLRVGAREINTVESISLGFRSAMFSLDDPSTGEEIGAMLTSSGFGSDSIILRWRDEELLVNGLDLLRAWVEEIDPEAAKSFPRR